MSYYAMVVVVEADSGDDALDRMNYHEGILFIGDPWAVYPHEGGAFDTASSINQHPSIRLLLGKRPLTGS